MNRDDEPGCRGEDCERALEQLESYLDGELPDARQEDIQAHLRACYPCTDRASFEEQLRAIVRDRCVDDPPDGLVARIRSHLDAGDGRDA